MNSTSSIMDGPFFQAAREGRNAWWMYVVTLALVVSLTLAGSFSLLLPLVLVYRTASLEGIPAPLALAAALLPFAFIYVGLWLGLRFLHRRRFLSLVNPGGPFRWRLALLSGGLWFALSALGDFVLSRLQPGNYTWSFQPTAFLTILPVALLLLPLQTAAEELVFRGYLTQALGLRARHFWLPWIGPSVLFFLLHAANPEVATYGPLLTLPAYLLIGLLLSWITLRSQGLEASLGLHLANNLYAGLVVTFAGSALSTPALFTIQKYDPLAGLIALGVTALVFLFLLGAVTRRSFWRLAAAGLLLLTACTPGAGSQTRELVTSAPTLALEDCWLTAAGVSPVSAECGVLEVLENPADEAGRKIPINVAVIRAGSSSPAPDPLFLLAGGPGQAATQAFLPLLPALSRVNFKRDIVLFDQRGTGKSGALSCAQGPDPERPVGEFTPPQAVTTELAACLKKLDADPRFYTTRYAMQDLDAVRKALGYGPVNLIGVSYGTRAAMTYLQLYPQNVRTLVLDGVVPPGWVLGASIRKDAQRALDLIFARCAADPACLQVYPDLKGDLDEVMKALAQNPVEVSVPDPTSGADTQVKIDHRLAGAMLRLLSYDSVAGALIPWMVHLAAQGDLRPLASQYLQVQSATAGAIETGMFYAVICSEDVPFLPAGGESGDYFFYPIDEYWQAACQAYPANPQPEAERQFAPLEVPALIISGEADPVTPPENGALAAKVLPDSQQVVFKGMGHGNLTTGCMPNLVRELVENGEVKGLDTTCVERSAPLHFFLSPLGPQP